jgi:hypothetical protein
LKKVCDVNLERATLNFLAKQAEGKPDANKEPDDLEMIGGTSEDDFSEAIALVRFKQFGVSVDVLAKKSYFSDLDRCSRNMAHY